MSLFLRPRWSRDLNIPAKNHIRMDDINLRGDSIMRQDEAHFSDMQCRDQSSD